MSALEASIFVVDEAAAVGGGNKTDHGSPEYPREKPSRLELKQWLETWQDTLVSAGFGAVLRKETPYDLAKLKPKELEAAAESDSDATKAAIASENRRIERENKANKVEYDARMRELQNRLAARLIKALRRKAPIKLKDLKDECGHVAADGSVSTDSFDGVKL